MRARRKLVDTIADLLAVEERDFVRLRGGLTLSHDPTQRDDKHRLALTMSRSNVAPSATEIDVVKRELRDACEKTGVVATDIDVERDLINGRMHFCRIWFYPYKQLALGGI